MNIYPNNLFLRKVFCRSLVSEQRLVIEPKCSVSSHYQPLPRRNCSGFRLLEESGKIGTTALMTVKGFDTAKKCPAMNIYPNNLFLRKVIGAVVPIFPLSSSKRKPGQLRLGSG